MAPLNVIPLYVEINCKKRKNMKKEGRRREDEEGERKRRMKNRFTKSR